MAKYRLVGVFPERETPTNQIGLIVVADASTVVVIKRKINRIDAPCVLTIWGNSVTHAYRITRPLPSSRSVALEMFGICRLKIRRNLQARLGLPDSMVSKTMGLVPHSIPAALISATAFFAFSTLSM